MPLEAGNQWSRHRYSRDLHLLPSHALNSCPAALWTLGLAGQHGQPFRECKAFSGWAGEAGQWYHTLHLVQSVNALHSFRKCKAFYERRPCHVADHLCSNAFIIMNNSLFFNYLVRKCWIYFSETSHCCVLWCYSFPPSSSQEALWQGCTLSQC